MVAARRSPVIGVFDEPLRADQAVAELRNSRFGESQIGIAMRYPGEGTVVEEGMRIPDDPDSKAEKGGAIGLLTGAGLGALAGLGVLSGVVPVIGPALAGGTLGVILSNTALGAGVAGLTGTLIGWGIPEEEAKYYHNEWESGRTIVTVEAGERWNEAQAILRKHGAHDVGARAATATV